MLCTLNLVVLVGIFFRINNSLFGRLDRVCTYYKKMKVNIARVIKRGSTLIKVYNDFDLNNDGPFLFRVESNEDFGTIYCQARNEVGWQNQPCMFNIHPGGMN